MRKTSEFKRDLAYAEHWNFNRLRWFADSERMRRILNTIQETRTVSQIFRLRRHESDQTVIHRASQMHRQILDALIAGDSIAASQRMGASVQVPEPTSWLLALLAARLLRSWIRKNSVR